MIAKFFFAISKANCECHLWPSGGFVGIITMKDFAPLRLSTCNVSEAAKPNAKMRY